MSLQFKNELLFNIFIDMENKKKLKRKEFKIDDGQGNIIGQLVDIAVVTDPAIEFTTKYFNKADAFPFVKKENFKPSKERQEITGPVMVPNKDIIRVDEQTGEYYYCWFSEDTVRKCLEAYWQDSNHLGSKLEHLGVKIQEFLTIESWIIEDPENDKANALGFSGLPKGTWMATIKVKDAELWNALKQSDFKGFSIEGSFGIYSDLVLQEFELSQDLEDLIDDLFVSDDFKRQAIISITDLYSFVNVGQLSFNDYPESAKTNAQRALKWKEETGNDRGCGTMVGWARANQLAKGEKISYSTVKRMASFIRHEDNAKSGSYEEGCARIMYDAWGGDEGINWAINKVQQVERLIEEENMLRKKKK